MARNSNGVEFKELGRIQATDSQELVLSEMLKGKELQGLSISKYITSDSYTGWSRGIYIPEGEIINFLKLFPKEDLEEALEEEE